MVIVDERLVVCPRGLHFTTTEPGAKYCMMCTPRYHSLDSGWNSNIYEAVTHPPTLAAFTLGGWDAVIHMWFGQRWRRCAPSLVELNELRDAQLDYLLLTERIPRRFRLTDGSADGWRRCSDRRWDRVFFPPLRWLAVDMDGLLRNITINPA